MAIDFISVLILVRVVYFRVYKRNELFFTFFIFNLVIFLICFLLNKVDLSMGAAFGLFAVFSMLRYGTEDVSIKDMSYLFLVIAMGLINAVTKIKDASDGYEYLFLVMIDATIIRAHHCAGGGKGGPRATRSAGPVAASRPRSTPAPTPMVYRSASRLRLAKPTMSPPIRP